MSHKYRPVGWILAMGAMLVSPVFGQSEFPKSTLEISPFFGGSTFHRNTEGPGTEMMTGPTWGVRVSENPWEHFGLEQALSWNISEFTFLKPVRVDPADYRGLESRYFRFSLDGLFHFTERGSRVRPFVAAGIGGSRFSMPDTTRDIIFGGVTPVGQRVNADTLFQVNYGGGVKVRLTNLLSLRGDIRGLHSAYPTFGLSTQPNGGAYIPTGNRLNAVEFTMGVGFNFGGSAASRPSVEVIGITADPAAAAVQGQGVDVGTPVRFKAEVRNPDNKTLQYRWRVNGQPVQGDGDTLIYTPTSPDAFRVEVEVSEVGKPPVGVPSTIIYAKAPPPPVDHRITVSAISADPAAALIGVPGAQNGSLTGLNAGNSISSGAPVRLSVTATDTLGHPLNFNWSINGAPAGTGNPFSYTPAQPGWYRVELAVTDTVQPAATANATAPVTIYARDGRGPTATACMATNANLTAGQSTPISMTGTVAQGHTLRIQWTASEGTVTNPTSAQATFNSATVNFPTSPQVQTKTITLTATVTDDNGATANCSTTVRVSTDPQAVHYGDILFSQNSSRVDNAAKRVLLERVYPELTGPYQGYTLALVGHTDDSERTNVNLDRNRVRNSAAVLTAATGSCMALELNRVRADWVGQTQSEYKDASGLASTAGSNINRNDPRSRNRRVEIWLVPAGKPMPAVMRQTQTLDPAQMRAIGCPR